MKRGRPQEAHGKGDNHGEQSRPKSKSKSKPKKKAPLVANAPVAGHKSRAPHRSKSHNSGKTPDGLALTDEEKAAAARRQERVQVYQNGEKVTMSRKAVQREHLRAKLGKLEQRIEEAAELNVDREEFMLGGGGGFLEAEAGTLERTNKVTQKEVKANVAASAARQVFDLDLPELGPYRVDWTGNGRHLLLAGSKGHVAMLDMNAGQDSSKLLTELHLRETVRDACFLHNHSMFAVAQKKHLYIYDRDGVELHCLRQHVEPTRLSFLPYHFLLAAASTTGYLKYQDVSTGTVVSEHRTKLGACHVMGQNPQNGVLHLGHHNGTVTLWSPAQPNPLAKLLCHRGPLQALAVDPSGRYMATAGVDCNFKVWDLRMWKETHAYLTTRPVESLAVSQQGLLGVGFGSHVQVWRKEAWYMPKAKSPYMRHEYPGKQVGCLKFRPFEDVLGVGHSGGCGSVVVPGAGEANYDALEHNPFESRKERREAEVHRLLDKLPPETIALDQDFVGTVDKDPKQLQEERRMLKQAEDEARGADSGDGKEKRRMRGRSKIGAKLKRKRKNIIDQERVQLQGRLEKERAGKAEARKAAKEAKDGRQAAAVEDGSAAPPPAAIGRFFAKSV